jgi:FkbM family methyltransferase
LDTCLGAETVIDRTVLEVFMKVPDNDPPVQVNVSVPVVLPNGVLHHIAGNVKDGTRLRIGSGHLQGLVWQKEGTHTGYIVGDYEPHVQESLRIFIRPGMTCYDLGAHHGFHSFLMARFAGPGGKVYAFEPQPRNVEFIKAALLNNLETEIEVIHAAVADSTGLRTFHFVSSDSMLGKLSGTEKHPEWGDATYEEETVPVVSLDDWMKLKEARPPDLMKIDVEGAESSVLMGAEKTLTSRYPLILLSVHGGRQMLACTEILDKFGYRIDVIRDGDVLFASKK